MKEWVAPTPSQKILIAHSISYFENFNKRSPASLSRAGSLPARTHPIAVYDQIELFDQGSAGRPIAVHYAEFHRAQPEIADLASCIFYIIKKKAQVDFFRNFPFFADPEIEIKPIRPFLLAE